MEKDRALRIFVDAHVFDGRPQGTLTFIKGIYRSMAGRPGIRLYLGAHDTDHLATIFPSADNLILVKYSSRSSVRRLLFEIPMMVRKYRIDYAHFQYIAPPWKNCRHIVTIHDVIFKDFPDEFSWFYRVQKRILYGMAARRADILTTVSEFSQASIRKFLRTGPKPIHVIPNGVSKKFFEPYDSRKSGDYIRGKYGLGDFILYVSRIEPRKNHLFLMNAWMQLRLYEKGIHLVFLGHETIPVPELDRYVERLPAEAKAFFLLREDVDDADLLEMYRACRLFVYPSRAEGFGIPPLEAAALKKPVLCSNTSAMSEFSFFGNHLFDPNDAPGFRDLLAHTIGNPQDETCLQQVATRIREHYSWDTSASLLFGLLASERKSVNLADS